MVSKADDQLDADKQGMEELLRLSVMLFYRPELLSEYQRLQRELNRSQKEVLGRQSYRKDPLAEFERLYKLWTRTESTRKIL